MKALTILIVFTGLSALLLASCASRKKTMDVHADYSAAASAALSQVVVREIKAFGDTLKGVYYTPDSDTGSTISGESSGIKFSGNIKARKNINGETFGQDIELNIIAKPVSKISEKLNTNVTATADSSTHQQIDQVKSEEQKGFSLPGWVSIVMVIILLIVIVKIFRK